MSTSSMFSSLVVAVFSAWVSVTAADLSSEFAHHAVLDPLELMKLYWTVDWENETVSFAVEAATTGWVGFGFSSGNGKMVDSDVVIGWVKDSKGYLTDRFADAKAVPPLDKENNYVLTGFTDPKDNKIQQGTTKVVFAYHTEDPTSDDDVKYHTYRGSKSILLLNSLDKKQVNETGWMEFIIQNKNVTIPKKKTTYWCSFIKAPEITTKHHITKYEPYVQEGNEGFVHHLLVYECPGKFNESFYGPGFDCQSNPNMPLEQCYSSSVVAAWAVGGEAFYYPPKAGYPIGTADSPSSYLLELHYDNTDGVEGHNDSSGLRFYYTSNLREYDAGIFAIGEATTSFLIIPPKQESWLSVGYCSKECYKQNLNSTKLPEKGIKIFAAVLHTHLQGRATWTKHVRDGVELPEIARDDNYDFNFQGFQVLRKEVHIKPGDDLIHYCKYDTMDREKLVRGGFSTSQEMCLDFLFYYPRMVNATSYCNSVRRKPVLDFIEKHLFCTWTRFEAEARENSEMAYLTSSWSNPLIGWNITWTNEMVADLKRGYNQAKTFISVCLWERSANYTLPVPEITEAQPRPKSNCPEHTTPAVTKLPPPESNSFLAAASRTVVLSLLTPYLMFL